MKIIEPLTVTDAILTASNIVENDHAEYVAGTTYVAGSRVIILSTHKIYESLQAANTGNDPATEPTWWLDVGATNRWQMFDESVGSQSSNADSIELTFAAVGRVNSIALLNIAADSVRITATDAIDGVVYDKTYPLNSVDGIIDWHTYFYNPIIRTTNLAIFDLPLYLGLSIDVTITDTGGTAACGVCVIGYYTQIGGTQYGASVGIQDYSIKQQDSFGNYTILERAFNNKGSFDVLIDKKMVDRVHQLLAKYRAKPLVYAATDVYNSTTIYGFYRDFSVVISYLNQSLCTLEIEGLT